VEPEIVDAKGNEGRQMPPLPETWKVFHGLTTKPTPDDQG
jgi:hypothetical protein